MVVGVCGTAIDTAGVEWWEQSEESWRVAKENWGCSNERSAIGGKALSSEQWFGVARSSGWIFSRSSIWRRRDRMTGAAVRELAGITRGGQGVVF